MFTMEKASPAGIPVSVEWTYRLLLSWGVVEIGSTVHYVAASGGNGPAPVEASAMLLLVVPVLAAAFTVRRGWASGYIVAVPVALFLLGGAVGAAVLVGRPLVLHFLQAAVAIALLALLFKKETRSYCFS
ncbi:hypothetical protein [Nocardiopsis baichengensis]|uniref:hypothetical protein n=1 Tax=Nocardiopsis baichengensis TaxID=280240 RepID=UPI000348E8E8|nr:hypothetical protein [Nocardiopsis baichengensis]